MSWKTIVMAALCAATSLPLAGQVVEFDRKEDSKSINALHAVRFWDDNTVAFAGRSTGGVHFVNLNDLAVTRSVDVMQGRVDEFEFSADRKGMIITTFENEVAYYDMYKAKVLHQVGEYYPDYSTGKRLGFSPDGKCFGTFLECSMMYWDKVTGLRTDSVPERADECIYEVAYSTDGSRVYCGGNHAVWIYDRNDQSNDEGTPLIDKSVVTCLRMRADHRQLAVATRESIYLYDAALNLQFDLKEQENWVNGIRYSPDGKRIYACSGSFMDKDYTVRVWDTETGACLGTMTGHRDQVDAMDISPNGKWIATASMDGTVKLWHADRLQLVLTIVPIKAIDGMQILCFTPDGKFFGTPIPTGEGELVRAGKTLASKGTTSKRAKKAVRKSIRKFEGEKGQS